MNFDDWVINWEECLLQESLENFNFQHLYKEMFRAKQTGNSHLAERLMIQMEQLRNRQLPKLDRHIVQSVLPHLPSFASDVLNKSQTELGRIERSNCINAAFNFYDKPPYWEPYSTMNFLNRIQTNFIQLLNQEKFKFGDLVVMWSRTGGSWDNQAINVHKINKIDFDFPYGLVFDHIAVRLTEDLVFHKPDPTPESCYQIDYITSMIASTVANRGFEMTFHRRTIDP